MATTAKQKAAIDAAWAACREATRRIPNLPWDEYLKAEEPIWRRYLAAEREILTAREAA